jgi:4-amino-4-deoxy-L-arabinose transferase-like glycosyltransferase
VSDSDRTSSRVPWALALLVTAAFFAFVAPTLAWLEFTHGLENLNVSTVLELRRGDRGTSWLVPTLEGEPRIHKPPLTAWITSRFFDDATLAALDDPDASQRHRAYKRLAWQVRLSGLLSACLTLLATFALGVTLAPGRDRTLTGLFAITVAATTLYTLRFGRQATTDVQLALWVTIANVLVAQLLLMRVSWITAIGCGAALGLALMSKGPVALVQSVLPAVIFATWRRWRAPCANESRARWQPLLAGIVVMLAVGGAWYAIVLARVPGVWSQWLAEVTRVGATDNAGDNPLSYLTILPYLLPWTPFAVVGAVEAILRYRDARELTGPMLALLTVVVPVVVMSFFPDRKERYLLPLTAPAAVLAARGMIVAAADARHRIDWLFSVQWVGFLLAVIAFPIAGATVLKRADAITPWYSPTVATIAVIFGGVVVGSGYLLFQNQMRRDACLGAACTLLVCGLIVMLGGHALALAGYRHSPDGLSQMRPLADSIRSSMPDAEMYNWRRDGRRKRIAPDLSIYMNRVTRWIADPNALPHSQRAQVCVTVHSPKREPVEPAPPAGWRFFERAKRDDDWYVAFVRDPSRR